MDTPKKKKSEEEWAHELTFEFHVLRKKGTEPRLRAILESFPEVFL